MLSSLSYLGATLLLEMNARPVPETVQFAMANGGVESI
jgi:hypothetical protein